jgi:nucleoside-diphosphate-sugar epimerase
VVFNVGAALHGSAAVQYAVNVTGVGRLVQAAHQAGIRRLVHVSSIAVYGYSGPDYITEDIPLEPAAEYYAQSKALGEQKLLADADALGLEAVVIRPGMIYGPGSGFWTGKVFDLARRRPTLLPGDGDTRCPVIFIDDLVALLRLAADHPAAVGQVFNAVTDEHVTWRDYLSAYAALAGHRILLPVPLTLVSLVGLIVQPYLRLFREPQPIREMINALFARSRVYSMAKAARLLDWRPPTTLAAGVAASAEWLRESGRLAS